MNQPRTLDVSHLAPGAFGYRSVMWWGTMGIVVIEATAFALTIQSYAPTFEDISQGAPTDTFAAGAYIGVAVTVSDEGQPIADTTIHAIVRGATGAIVYDGTVTTGPDGRATFQLRRYSGVGGTGTYTVEAFAASGDKSATLTKTFEVYGRTRQF